MIEFQTMLYRAYLTDFEYGWQIDPDFLFQSKKYESPTDAMQELNFHSPEHNNWFVTMRMFENNEIVEEEIFDSSVIDCEYDYLLPI
jgi:hypothetical protein